MEGCLCAAPAPRHPKRALAITQMILLYRLLHGPR